MTDETRRKFRVIAWTGGFTLVAALATSDPARPDTEPGHLIAEARKTDPPAFDELEARVEPTKEPFHGRFAVQRRKPPVAFSIGKPSSLECL